MDELSLLNAAFCYSVSDLEKKKIEHTSMLLYFLVYVLQETFFSVSQT